MTGIAGIHHAGVRKEHKQRRDHARMPHTSAHRESIRVRVTEPREVEGGRCR